MHRHLECDGGLGRGGEGEVDVVEVRREVMAVVRPAEVVPPRRWGGE